ncbi:MAG: uroporphyrinogen decarboxylase/cobalamine-independent methonine synthase family protein [Planctomycetota bacterium]|jgi:hypothetical protein
MSKSDIEILKPLLERYREIAELPIQEEKRTLWRDHFSLRSTRVPILATYGMWNVWCCQLWGEDQMTCEDPLYRSYERQLKMMIFQHEEVGDDVIQEPWITLRASIKGGWGSLWGVEEKMHDAGVEGGAKSYDPPLTDWADMEKLSYTPHEIDEEDTARNLEKLSAAVDGILPIDVDRSPAYSGFSADISTSIAKLRGLETLMMDMYEYPDELHRLLAFMRDGILANNDAAEAAGAYSLTSGSNQAMCYAGSLQDPTPNSGPVTRKDLWGFCAAQEYTLISPEFHDEFLFQYQKPIFEKFGLVHYGCCEDLTKKLDMLRTLPNLRSIAVTPTADVAKCAEQIGQDYAMAWRPNPADMVCCGYNEDLIGRIIGEGLEACKGGYPHIHLKDVETMEDDNTRLKRWVALVRDISEGF